MGNETNVFVNELCEDFLQIFRDLPEILSRALDNVGRVYAVMGDFSNAAK